MTGTPCTRGLWAASLAAGAFVLATHLGVWVNLSPSLPMGIYRTVERPAARGSTVLVCLPAAVGRFAVDRGYLPRGPCPGGAGRLGKIVAAMGGDTVDVEENGVTINGHRVPGSGPRTVDRRGRPLPHLPTGARVVPPGMVFLLATHHPLSFDSRYYGAVPYSDLSAVLCKVSLSFTGSDAGCSGSSSVWETWPRCTTLCGW
jgi:conjugative transfer signal peptidase TraF